MKIKFIITAKEWRDKTYGNSYFSAQVKETKSGNVIIKLPYQYGYGDQALHSVIEELKMLQLLPNKRSFFSELPISYTKIGNCKKKEVIQFGEYSVSVKPPKKLEKV